MTEICKIKETLTTALCSEVAKGVQAINADEAEKVTNMIEKLSKTAYYDKITEAMDESEKYGYTDRHRNEKRYIDEYMRNPREFRDEMRYGYDDGRNNRNDSRYNNSDSRYGNNDSRYGQAYNSYMSAKKHFTDTNSQTDKEDMRVHAQEHLSDTMSTMREIWKMADTDLKRRMKSDLTTLVNEMAI